MTLFGPDVSGYQRGLQLVRGTPFAAAKATEGTGWVDDTYADFKTQAARTGAIFWAYHFLGEGNAAAQAAHAHAIVGATPLMLDWEGIKDPATGAYTSRPSLLDACAFTDAYRGLGGRIWSTYLPRWYWSDPKGLDSPPLAPIAQRGLALISSNYTVYSDTGPGWEGYGGMQPALWQFTDSQPYGGRPVDFNAYRGTSAQLAALVAGQPAAASATTTARTQRTRENDMHADLQLNKPVVFTNPAAVTLSDSATLLLAADFGDATVRVATFSFKSASWSVDSRQVARTSGAFKLSLPPDVNKVSVTVTALAPGATVGLDVLA